ncbi:MAG: hypothetical protein AAEJ43_06220 [Gammaproteobacteria bacterium]|jgi:hypothetical protein|nr:hypothetical protein [Pseudomonadota bacterium]
MSFWIAAWVFLFAFVACLASIFGAVRWRDNLPFALAMAAVMVVAALIIMET